MLEDHIVVGDGWCNEVIAGFDRHPEADAIICGAERVAALPRSGQLPAHLGAVPHSARHEVPLHGSPGTGIIAFPATALSRTAPEPGYLE